MKHNKKWIIGEPGGPSGPFYSIVTQSGRVIALQIPDREVAELLVKVKAIIDCDFDMVHHAGSRLREIQERDLEKPAFKKGAQDYIIRAVAEALFSGFSFWEETL